MRISTIVTLLIGLVVGALLTSALSTSGRGFSLQLCPVPPAATDSSSAARDGQGAPGREAMSPFGKER